MLVSGEICVSFCVMVLNHLVALSGRCVTVFFLVRAMVPLYSRDLGRINHGLAVD